MSYVKKGETLMSWLHVSLAALAVAGLMMTAAPVHAQNQPTLAIYQGGVPVTTVAPGAAIEIRASGLHRNEQYFVQQPNAPVIWPITPNDDGALSVSATAPTLPASGYSYSLGHFRGHSPEVDVVITLSVS
jgi:hypothetical protein